MSSRIHNLIVAAVNAGQGFAQASDKVKAAIAAELKVTKSPEKRNAFLLKHVAEPLAAAYSAKTGVALTAYVSTHGVVSIKDAEKPADGKRSSSSIAAVLMMRKWFTQTSNKPKAKRDPVKTLVSAFQKLTAAQRRKFREEIAV
jgi:hypothetical protein